MKATIVLLAALCGVTALFVRGWTGAVAIARREIQSSANTKDTGSPLPLHIAIGIFTNFFDTLGISSFATATAFFKINRTMNNRIIPGTLSVGLTLPTVVQAVVLTTVMEVDAVTIFSMTAACAAGAWLGAGVVSGWSKRKVETGLCFTLLVTAVLIFGTQRGLFAAGGDALGIRGMPLLVGLAGNFALGAFTTLGLRSYGPCLIMLSLLGMNPSAAIPVMLSSCAFAMPFAGLRFIREKNYHLPAALGLTAGGIPAVILAAYIGRTLPLAAMRWAVIAVILWAAFTMFLSAALGKSDAK